MRGGRKTGDRPYLYIGTGSWDQGNGTKTMGLGPWGLREASAGCMDAAVCGAALTTSTDSAPTFVPSAWPYRNSRRKAAIARDFNVLRSRLRCL